MQPHLALGASGANGPAAAKLAMAEHGQERGHAKEDLAVRAPILTHSSVTRVLAQVNNIPIYIVHIATYMVI